MRYFLLPLLLSCALTGRAQHNAEKTTLTRILDAQMRAWNAGDLDGYMAAGYWQNDSLLFVGKNGPTYGYDSTLARYRRSYPDPAAMGTLHFDILRVQVLSGKNAFMAGKWRLQRAAGPLGGAFTLLFEKKDGRWVIIADHSS